MLFFCKCDTRIFLKSFFDAKKIISELSHVVYDQFMAVGRGFWTKQHSTLQAFRIFAPIISCMHEIVQKFPHPSRPLSSSPIDVASSTARPWFRIRRHTTASSKAIPCKAFTNSDSHWPTPSLRTNDKSCVDVHSKKAASNANICLQGF